MTPPTVLSRWLPASRRVCSCLGAALAAGALCCAQPASSAGDSSLIVVPRPSTQTGLSYFKLTARPGQAAQAGAIELRNPSARQLRVALAAVNGQTLSTLGSGYASPGSRQLGSTRWLRLERNYVVLAPHKSQVIQVSVGIPHRAAAGDYLSGVSIEALDQSAQAAAHKGMSVSSVDRYVIGAEVSIAGPRHPLIRFTGAEVQRQPAGLTFLLLTVNPGNVILQNNYGRALITQGQRTVASVPLGPGTFVTGTSIAYPIPTPQEHPQEGTVYRVRAYLRYAGGIAWLDTLVRFGRAGALAQQLYGGPKAPSHSSGFPTWLAVLLGVLAVLAVAGIVWLVFLLARRRRESERSTLRMLERALEESRLSGEPLSLLTVTLFADEAASGDWKLVLHSRLRRTDHLCRLSGRRFLVLAPDTDAPGAEALAADLRRHVERVGGGNGGGTVDVHFPDGNAKAAELLAQLSRASGGAYALTPSG